MKGRFSACILHLIAHVNWRISSQQQRHNVHVAFLSCEVERSDSLPRDCAGGGAVLQQRGGYLHLILLGSYVEWSIAILGKKKIAPVAFSKITRNLHFIFK